MIFVHHTTIVNDNVKVGKNFYVWHFTHIPSESSIRDNCTLEQNLMVDPKIKIGAGCKIKNNVSIYEEIEMGNKVLCGLCSVFPNIINLRAFINRKNKFKKLFLEKELPWI